MGYNRRRDTVGYRHIRSRSYKIWESSMTKDSECAICTPKYSRISLAVVLHATSAVALNLYGSFITRKYLECPSAHYNSCRIVFPDIKQLHAACEETRIQDGASRTSSSTFRHFRRSNPDVPTLAGQVLMTLTTLLSIRIYPDGYQGPGKSVFRICHRCNKIGERIN